MGGLTVQDTAPSMVRATHSPGYAAGAGIHATSGTYFPTKLIMCGVCVE